MRLWGGDRKAGARATCWLLLGLLWSLLSLSAAVAHEVRPALVQIVETAPGSYDVTWKQPVVGDMALRLAPHLSSGVLDRPPTGEADAPGFLVRTWQVRGGPPLDGQTLSVEGLAQSVTDVLLRVTTADGRTVNDVLRPAAPSRRLALAAPQGLRVPAYVSLGIEHILTGVDHLLFVLGLLLLIGPSWRLVKAITAFTAAHSITLALAALGIVHFPAAIIEALVALSIVFVACELARPADAPPTLTRRHPWVIAFAFGLLHGLAFAGALSQVGLPPGAAPQALFLFNVGVEIGQLTFIGAALAVMAFIRRVRPRLGFVGDGLARVAPAYGIGGAAAFWLIERIAAV
ncbi:MAG: HupE/UreJ family protein [Caulobacterales bacterium]|nr:HupE/UreJ family protein [Caulobacterales bacterium]